MMQHLVICFAVIALFGTLLPLVGQSDATPRRVVIFLGAPGSGKGTQAKRLAKELCLPHISTGDLFREQVGGGTPLGKKVKGYLDKGELVPDALVLDMLFERVSQSDSEKGFILDGFPRTLVQAEALSKRLEGRVRLQVVELTVRDALIVKRIVGRRSCSECGHLYNVFFSPPAEEGLCDLCGGELAKRADDTAEVVEERLRVYHAQTAPLVRYYRKQGALISIDGEGEADLVFQQILQAI